MSVGRSSACAVRGAAVVLILLGLGSMGGVVGVVGSPRSAHAEGREGGVRPGGSTEAGAESVTVTVSPEQRTLTLGVDTGTTLLVTIAGPSAASALPGRTQATVGIVGPLIPRSTPGSFIAEYHVPSDRRPQSAIIAVEVVLPGGRRAYATAQLMLPAATNFPLLSSPNASVSLDIANRRFGPRKADADGNVRIPIVVPPDVAVGTARAVNEFGVATETEVNLQPQDYPRVLLMAPPEAEAGATVNVEVWAVAASGDPVPPEEIDLWAAAGKIRRSGGVPGMAAFSLTLPGAVKAGPVTLKASMEDGTSTTSGAIPLKVGPVAALVLSADVARLVVGSQGVGRVSAVAQDRFGNTVPATGIALETDGRTLPVKAQPEIVTAEVPAPAAWTGRDHLAVKATLGKIAATMDLPVTGGEPARVTLTSNLTRVDANGRNAVELLLEIFDERGTPTSARRVAWQTEDDGSIDPLPSPRFGTYVVRFVPRRALRDRSALITAAVDPGLVARARITVESGATRTAAARVGVASNLGSLFGQSAFIEATVPLRRLGRFGRLVSAGLALGYLHSEITTSPAVEFPAVHMDVNQTPILALARVRLPAEFPVEISLLGTAGISFATTEVTPTGDSNFGATRGAARALVIGAGADASVLLDPGELVIGARYLHGDLGRNSNGDQIEGNSIGVICDLGFRLGF